MVALNFQGGGLKFDVWGGTDAETFSAFCDEMCTAIETNFIEGTDEHRVILWDNLRAHSAPLVYQTVEDRDGPCRFSILPWPAYQPKYGPIEYKICDLISNMQYNTQGQMNLDQMEQEIKMLRHK